MVHLNPELKGQNLLFACCSGAVLLLSMVASALLGWSMGSGLATGGAVAMLNIMALAWMMRLFIGQGRPSAPGAVLFFTLKLFAAAGLLLAAILVFKAHALGIILGYSVVLVVMSLGYAFWASREEALRAGHR